MDAREYMAKKGIGQGGEEARPNTLEEKAWQRAREAGHHRPHAGTPYDWEDWERYHDKLAEGAESLEQKIDHSAHRSNREEGEDGAVQHTDPYRVGSPPEPSSLHLALTGLAVLLPPLAVGLAGGGPRRLAINLLLTLLGWVPGVVHALHWVRRTAK
jgi:uncharacterized membrane protein YqaE (UPF0057 family)